MSFIGIGRLISSNPLVLDVDGCRSRGYSTVMPSLNWIGKEAVINHHRQVPYHLLRCDNSLSCGHPDSGNLLVEGHNLLALKVLLPYYARQVKS